MNFTVEKNRIYYAVNEKVLAEITFIDQEPNSMVINHTFVDESLRGQGVASQLMQAAVEEIKRQNKHIEASCSYAIQWLHKHHDEA